MKLTTENLIDKIKKSKSTSSIVRSVNKNDNFLNIILIETNFLNENVTLNERIFYIKHSLLWDRTIEFSREESFA